MGCLTGGRMGTPKLTRSWRSDGALALARGQSLAVPREALPRLLFASFTNVGWALRPPKEPTFTRRVLPKRELGHA